MPRWTASAATHASCDGAVHGAARSGLGVARSGLGVGGLLPYIVLVCLHRPAAPSSSPVFTAPALQSRIKRCLTMRGTTSLCVSAQSTAAVPLRAAAAASPRVPPRAAANHIDDKLLLDLLRRFLPELLANTRTTSCCRS